MQEIEFKIFDEYKRIDSICCDIFSVDKGINRYIEQMEETPLSIWYKVPGWGNDYKQLKHIRWIRNRIAHDVNAVDCSIDDLNWLEEFHTRLLNQQDPLAKSYQIIREEQNRVTKNKQQNNSATYVNQKPIGKRESRILFWLVLIIAVCAVFGLLIYGINEVIKLINPYYAFQLF